MCANLSMPEVVSTPPQRFPYEFEVFRILRTEFGKDMLLAVCQVRGKRDHYLTFASLPALASYQKFGPGESSHKGTLTRPRKPSWTLQTEGGERRKNPSRLTIS
jgi:hypothetical protein